MPPSDDAEQSVYRAARDGLQRWLDTARSAVMAPWRRFKTQPAPTAISATVPVWQAQVDRIAAALTPSLREGWGAVNLPGEFALNDPYIQSNLALTKNLLVRVPDEVHVMVVKEILEGTNNQESTAQIADRVENILTFTGSENWDSRARTIAQTETNRHFNSSMLAHGLLLERQGRRDLRKQWDTRMDSNERPAHHDANDVIVASLGLPFIVGNEPLLFPGDPRGRADNVINCRCSVRILGGF